MGGDWSEWSDPPAVMWNVSMLMVCVAAVVDLFLPRSRTLRRGWKSTAVWIVALLASATVNGYLIPIGPLAVLWYLHAWRKEIDGDDLPPSATPTNP